jgi:hypothetical protein
MSLPNNEQRGLPRSVTSGGSLPGKAGVECENLSLPHEIGQFPYQPNSSCGPICVFCGLALHLQVSCFA